MGETVVRASIWLALLSYPAGPLGLVAGTERTRRLARAVWTSGAAAFVVHVISSFQVFYDWSHAVALDETARQVEELTGRGLGAGLYLNYLFTLVWVIDAAWWWRDPTAYLKRSRTGVLLLHGFFLFMIFNATVVFEDGVVRVLGLAVTLVSAIALDKAVRRRKRDR